MPGDPEDRKKRSFLGPLKERPRAASLFLFTLGLLIFAATVHAAGWQRLKVLGSALAGPGVLVLFFYPFAALWDVAGLWAVFASDVRRRVRFGELFAVRLAGEGVNGITPFLDVGGEPLKALLIASRFGIDKRTAVASVILDRSVLFFAEMLFWLTGLSLMTAFMPMPVEWRRGFFATGVIVFALAASLAMIQRKGLFLTTAGWLKRFHLSSMLEKFQVSMERMDAEITAFYAAKDLRLPSAFILHFLGWVTGAAETFLMLRVIGVPATLVQAMMLEAVLQMSRAATFFIPGNLGTQEAGLALGMGWLGFPPALGVAVSLLKRLRQLIWNGAGFAVWGVYQWLGE